MFIPQNKRQFLFEFLFYCGIIGGIQAIFTPLLDDYGGYNFFYIQGLIEIVGGARCKARRSL